MIRIQTSSAAQDVSLLMRLLDNRLPGVDAGFGIEQIQLFAPHTQWIDAQQQELTTTTSRPNGTDQLNGLIDRLRQRLGHQALSYRHLRASHLPEQSFVHCDQSGTHKTPTTLPPRPIRLLRPAEAIEVDQFDSLARPLQFNWRRQTIKRVNISGPERLSRQWWQKLDQDIWDHALGLRDYYRITDQEGRDLWVCGWHSQKEKVRWFVHGWFG